MTRNAADRATYLDPNQPVDVRVEDLLDRMTLAERFAQLAGAWSVGLADDGEFSEERARRLVPHGIGHLSRIGGATGLRPGERARFYNAIQRYLVDRTRLGVPAILHEESVAGFNARDATQFPQAIGLASTWDPDLVEAVAEVIRVQMRAVGARQTLSPVLDVTRDPRWGRTEETYGEDPYLIGRMGVAYVRGLQTDQLSDGVAATGKHFLGYGLSEGGLNRAPAHLGPRELREVVAAPFAAAIAEAGLASVMNAYNEVDGLPCAGSPEILDDLLRTELGFEGVVVADYTAVRQLMDHHRVAADPGEAGELALRAGLDVELPVHDCFDPPLRERVEDGSVPVEFVDRAVRRVLRMKFRLGLFEDPYVDADAAPSVYQTVEQRSLAKKAAQRSIVLLKNDGGLLPLDPAIGRLAVIGPAGDDVRLLLGDYSYPVHLEVLSERDGPPHGEDGMPVAAEGPFAPGPYYGPMVPLLDGIRGKVAPETEIVVAEGCEITGRDRDGLEAARHAAGTADVAVVAVGGRSGLSSVSTTGEFHDAADLGLTGLQQELVEAVVATGTPTVVVLVNGRPLALPWIAEHVPAIVESWLPGQEGGDAVADVLFGDVNPAGRLPISLPRAVGQVPVFHNHKSGGGRTAPLGDYRDLPVSPLFPFGHGLSYTSFAYRDLELTPSRPQTDGAFTVTFEIVNQGSRDGDEVAQLYLYDRTASVTRPVRRLAGFVRVEVPAGATKRVTFRVDASQLGLYDPSLRLVVEPGPVDVMVGASSEDIRLRGVVELSGDVRELTAPETVPTDVTIR